MLAHHLPGTVQPALDGVDGDFQVIGRFRRSQLVDVAQDSIITSYDCGSTGGIRMRAIIDAGQIVASLGSRILGRTAAEDMKDADDKVIVSAGELIEEWHIAKINAAGIQEVKIRSVLTCEAKNGVCGKCYGRDLARGTPVNMGEAVGVIAAQSIGEPGTQLTMRTFHIGGAASRAAVDSSVEAKSNGIVRFTPTMRYVTNARGEQIVITRSGEVIIADALAAADVDFEYERWALRPYPLFEWGARWLQANRPQAPRLEI